MQDSCYCSASSNPPCSFCETANYCEDCDIATIEDYCPNCGDAFNEEDFILSGMFRDITQLKHKVKNFNLVI